MKKIRINELARELEVKPGVIIDLLPELGVQEKKTHSSSIDEDVATHSATAFDWLRRISKRGSGNLEWPSTGSSCTAMQARLIKSSRRQS